MFKTLLALPRTVWLIGLISLVNDSASEMLYPLMPLYLVSVLMVGPKVLGVIEGIAEASSSIFKLVSGVIVDRTKKAKPWKGTASYYDVVVHAQSNKDAAWYYPEPKLAAKNISGYVAFWKGVEVVD